MPCVRSIGPRVFMRTQGSTITLSHTPSLPVADRDVAEAAAGAVTGQVRAVG